MKYSALLLLALSFSCFADDAFSPQQIRWSLGSFNETVIQAAPITSVGFALAIEMPVSEGSKYWVEALGKSMTLAGGSEAQIFLGAKRVVTLAKRYELAIAVGPEYVHTANDLFNGGYFGLAGLATGTFWIDEHWGVSAVPSYQAVFRSGVENSAGLSLMLTYGR